MIFNDDDLELTRVQLARAEKVLASLRRDILPANPERFRLWAEPYIDQIRSLRREIDVYLGVEPNSLDNTHVAEERGTIREVDLDQRSFVLRDRHGDQPDLVCEYDSDLESLVKSLLDTAVVVTGRMRVSRKTSRQALEVETVEPAQGDVGGAEATVSSQGAS